MKGTNEDGAESSALPEESTAPPLELEDLDDLLVEEPGAHLDFDIEDVLVTEEVSAAQAAALEQASLAHSESAASAGSRHTQSRQADAPNHPGEDTRRRSGIGRRVRRLFASIFGG